MGQSKSRLPCPSRCATVTVSKFNQVPILIKLVGPEFRLHCFRNFLDS